MTERRVEAAGRDPGGTMSPPPGNRLRIVALLAAYNEADVIGWVIRHLIEQGIAVYFLDNGSTDSTVDEVRPFLNRGVIGIESFGGAPGAAVDGSPFQWEAILKRKEALGQRTRGRLVHPS